MRIGIVTTWFERGAAYVSRQYLDALKKEHDVFIYARGGESFALQTEWDKSFVTWGDRTWGKDFSTETTNKNKTHFKQWILSQKLDVVFFNEEHWWEPIIICNELGIRAGAYVDYYTKETVPLFGLYDFLICNTRRHHDAFKWHPQAHYVPWGTNISIFKPTTFDLVNSGQVTFFHSAGMNPNRKGTDILIRVFSKLVLEVSNVQLVIHSQIDVRKAFPVLVPVIDALILQKKLIIRIETVGAPGLYYLGDVYVYPTRLEGIGLTIVEALASGLPTIVPDEGPMNEFVTNESGRLVCVAQHARRDDNYYWPQCLVDEKSLFNGMKYYCENRSSIPQLKKQARIRAETILNWATNSRIIGSIFFNSELCSPEVNRKLQHKARRLDRIKTHTVRRFFHKVRILNLRIIPYIFKYLRRNKHA